MASFSPICCGLTARLHDRRQEAERQASGPISGRTCTRAGTQAPQSRVSKRPPPARTGGGGGAGRSGVLARQRSTKRQQTKAEEALCKKRLETEERFRGEGGRLKHGVAQMVRQLGCLSPVGAMEGEIPRPRRAGWDSLERMREESWQGSGPSGLREEVVFEVVRERPREDIWGGRRRMRLWV
ncbi:hypothetical protein BDW02DRAFT_581666 [Decorospora gaudefroyi]|uniref:Uncharacterized protein n=1 Tax=Decorospora gaudefroyi TaxID=184978 RepID=A0A6A5KA08_9PLEO|nr:hypothetical protein BDW02DRAFT_581666 [Decorospora gaudefroyi]